MFLVVSGPPGSGKSTLATALAGDLGLPLLAKDEIKEDLLRDEQVDDAEQSRAVGRQAVRSLLQEARTLDGAVLDSVWVDRATARRELAGLGQVVEVFCRCDLETMRARYRARSPSRSAGHFDAERSDRELWPPKALTPLAGPWPIVEVDTTAPVDRPDVLRRVRDLSADSE